MWHALDRNDDFGRAAQLAYYFILSLFPLLIFVSSLAGIFFASEHGLYERLLGYLARIMPYSAFDLVRGAISDITSSAGRGKVSLGLVITLWTASLGMEALIRGLNVAYDVREFRPWWRRRLLAIAFTVILSVIAFGVLIIILWGDGLGRWLADDLQWGRTFAFAWSLLQWTAVGGAILFALNLIYLLAPNLKQQRWQAIMPGSFVALAIWLTASAGFKLYLRYFDSYAKTYGSLGAIIVLLIWLYLLAFSILVGGEVNSEIRKAAAEAGVPRSELPQEAHDA